jgi:hypothetical protein
MVENWCKRWTIWLRSGWLWAVHAALQEMTKNSFSGRPKWSRSWETAAFGMKTDQSNHPNIQEVHKRKPKSTTSSGSQGSVDFTRFLLSVSGRTLRLWAGPCNSHTAPGQIQLLFKWFSLQVIHGSPRYTSIVKQSGITSVTYEYKGDNSSNSGWILIKVVSFHLDQGFLSDGLSQYRIQPADGEHSKGDHSPPEEI